jgi:hypothetical protein
VELAMAYLDLRTVWLPDWLSADRDARGRCRKDLRDFVELRPDTRSFSELLKVAMPMRFWEETLVKGNVRTEINSEYLLHHLRLNGFGSIENRNEKTGQSFIRVENNVVHEIRPKDIKAYLRSFIVQRNFSLQLRNAVNNSSRIGSDLFELLGEKKIDFTDFDHNRQFLFFQNATWEVMPGRTMVHRPQEVNKFVWHDEIIPHSVRRTEPAFTITESDGEYDISVSSTRSKFFCYLINTCRIYWHEEIERLTPDNGSYNPKDHQFDIASPMLVPDEVEEQKMHLINKIFVLGYLLHRYKDQSRAWCVFAMDWKMSDSNDESNGRSGKSFCFKALRNMMSTVTLSGRNPKLTDNPHMYDRVTEHTDLLFLNDAARYLDFNHFFDTVDDALIVNPKNNRSYEIPFELAPKIVITSNYTPNATDPSTQGRLLYTVFSDYYHEKTDDNEYIETRSIFDDFGMKLQDSLYPDEDWNADINFFVDCLQFYLSTVDRSVKINPPMKNVQQRTLLAMMGQNFHDWAIVYFNTSGENVNVMRPKEDVMNDFIHASGAKNWTTQRFTKSIRSFCRKYGYTLNPIPYRNSQGRIVRKHNDKSAEMIYIQTTDDIDMGELSRDITPF